MGEELDDMDQDIPPTAELAALLNVLRDSIAEAENASGAVHRAHLDLSTYFDPGPLADLPEVETRARSAAEGLRTSWVTICFKLDMAKRALRRMDLILDSILGPGWRLRDL